MAQYKAIAAICDAIKRVLESAAGADPNQLRAELGVTKVAVEVYGASDFFDGKEIENGVSIFLYRVVPNLSHRTPPGRLLPNGHRQRTRLPIDLYLLLTIWGKLPQNQHTIAAWMMRTLEDYPTLPASLLNVGVYEGTFAPDESVELVVSEMSGEELLQLWELLDEEGMHRYQLSVPYIVRALFIDSKREQPQGEPVQARQLDMGVLEET